MATQPITVNLDGHAGCETVVVRGDAVYRGTRTSGSGCYSSAIEDYIVTIGGVRCEGTWDGDGRHNVTVVVVPAELRRKLRRLRRRQEAEALRRELARMSPADRAYFDGWDR